MALFQTPEEVRTAQLQAAQQQSLALQAQGLNPAAGAAYNLGNTLAGGIGGLWGGDARTQQEIQAQKNQDLMNNVDLTDYKSVMNAAKTFSNIDPRISMQLVQHAQQLNTKEDKLTWVEHGGYTYPQIETVDKQGNKSVKLGAGQIGWDMYMKQAEAKAGLTKTNKAGATGYNIDLGPGDAHAIFKDETGDVYIVRQTPNGAVRDYGRGGANDTDWQKNTFYRSNEDRTPLANVNQQATSVMNELQGRTVEGPLGGRELDAETKKAVATSTVTRASEGWKNPNIQAQYKTYENYRNAIMEEEVSKYEGNLFLGTQRKSLADIKQQAELNKFDKQRGTLSRPDMGDGNWNPY